MDTSLLIYLDGIWKRVDIYEDIPIAVMIQQLDINALDSRKSLHKTICCTKYK